MKNADQQITGRDGYIMRQALAYAIEAIERLPARQQELSDQDGMRQLLAAMGQAEHYLAGARRHLEPWPSDAAPAAVIIQFPRAQALTEAEKCGVKGDALTTFLETAIDLLEGGTLPEAHRALAARIDADRDLFRAAIAVALNAIDKETRAPAPRKRRRRKTAA